MKGTPRSPSITNTGLRRAHAHAHARTAFIHHPLLAGLSDVSVISCPARLNYDVNKSLLVSTSTPASRVREQTRTRTQTHLSESVSCNSCMNLTSHAADRRTNSAGTLHKRVHLQLCLRIKLSHSLIPTIAPYFYFLRVSHEAFVKPLTGSCQPVMFVCSNGVISETQVSVFAELLLEVMLKTLD